MILNTEAILNTHEQLLKEIAARLEKIEMLMGLADQRIPILSGVFDIDRHAQTEAYLAGYLTSKCDFYHYDRNI